MAINLTTADKALKTFYLDAISEQLNNKISPFFAQIKHTTKDVYGKEVRKLVSYGMNGGISAGSEDGNLPRNSNNNYQCLVSTLKNLYGVIEISDKAIRASENNEGAFVNLLDAEMEGLINASTENFGRMLFGDGKGVLCKIESISSGTVKVDSTKFLKPGMIVDLRYSGGAILEGLDACKILTINGDNYFTVDKLYNPGVVAEDGLVTIQNSYGNELTGLEEIFSNELSLLYGIGRVENSWFNPYKKNDAGEIDELTIQTAIDAIEEKSGSTPNLIICSWGVRRALQKIFSQNKRSVDMVELNGGYKAMSYNGIPIVVDKYCPKGCMYILNTDFFELHQLCDWQWLADDDGRVLKQIPGKPIYTATLVKYAELMCYKPYAQGVIRGITEG